MPDQDAPSLSGSACGAVLATTPTPGSVQTYALAEKANATRRAYRSDFEMFGAWCRARRSVEPLKGISGHGGGLRRGVRQSRSKELRAHAIAAVDR